MTWSAPDAPNGVLTQYTLYVDFLNGSVVPLNFNPSVSSYVITGLTPYQSVRVALSASTNVGMGPNSTTETVTTAQTGKSYSIIKVDFNSDDGMQMQALFCNVNDLYHEIEQYTLSLWLCQNDLRQYLQNRACSLVLL